jgi:CheY-like chemotaxis protein
VSAPIVSTGPTILVVDDERVARRLLYRALTEEGYRVFEAAGAQEAMDVLDLAHWYVHLIMLDVVMPEVDGVELGRRILARWPPLRLLYMSAYPAEVLLQHGLSDPHVHFLAKPFTHDELLRKVEQASDRSEPSGPWRRTRGRRAIGPDRPWFDAGSASEV